RREHYPPPRDGDGDVPAAHRIRRVAQQQDRDPGVAGDAEMTRAMRNSRGLTLAELMSVSPTLGFIMAALFTLQRQRQLAYLTGSARVEAQQNARLALDSMITDLRSALPVAGSTTQVIG